MTERITIFVDEKLARELKSLAKKEGVSLSRLIAKSLEEFLIERKRKQAGRKLMGVRLTKEEVQEALKELSRIREGNCFSLQEPIN